MSQRLKLLLDENLGIKVYEELKRQGLKNEESSSKVFENISKAVHPLILG